MRILSTSGIYGCSVTGGIVGVRKYIYDVFGDAVNTASRMESNSLPMRINVSESTYNLVGEGDVFSIIYRMVL
jgi:class 3 adenylate cyclase